MQISSTERNESFTVTIDTLSSRARLHVPEPDWVHFLQDHFEKLRENSTYMTLDEKTMLRYQYRISDFLNDLQKTLGCDQAFRIANRLHSDLDFNLSLEGVHIPSEAYLSELRMRYLTNKTVYNSLT